ILIPAYLYLPGLFGLTALDVKSISGLTSVQVFCSSLIGMFFHRKHGAVSKRLVLSMGIPITAASLTGAVVSKSVQPASILTVFSVMAVIGAVFIFFKKETGDRLPPEEVSFN